MNSVSPSSLVFSTPLTSYSLFSLPPSPYSHSASKAVFHLVFISNAGSSASTTVIRFLPSLLRWSLPRLLRSSLLLVKPILLGWYCSISDLDEDLRTSNQERREDEPPQHPEFNCINSKPNSIHRISSLCRPILLTKLLGNLCHSVISIFHLLLFKVLVTRSLSRLLPTSSFFHIISSVVDQLILTRPEALYVCSTIFNVKVFEFSGSSLHLQQPALKTQHSVSTQFRYLLLDVLPWLKLAFSRALIQLIQSQIFSSFLSQATHSQTGAPWLKRGGGLRTLLLFGTTCLVLEIGLSSLDLVGTRWRIQMFQQGLSISEEVSRPLRLPKQMYEALDSSSSVSTAQPENYVENGNESLNSAQSTLNQAHLCEASEEDALFLRPMSVGIKGFIHQKGSEVASSQPFTSQRPNSLFKAAIQASFPVPKEVDWEGLLLREEISFVKEKEDLDLEEVSSVASGKAGSRGEEGVNFQKSEEDSCQAPLNSSEFMKAIDFLEEEDLCFEVLEQETCEATNEIPEFSRPSPPKALEIAQALRSSNASDSPTDLDKEYAGSTLVPVRPLGHASCSTSILQTLETIVQEEGLQHLLTVTAQDLLIRLLGIM